MQKRQGVSWRAISIAKNKPKPLRQAECIVIKKALKRLEPRVGYALIALGLLVLLVANLLSLALPFLIAAVQQSGDKQRLGWFVAIFVVILPVTIAIDIYIVYVLREVTQPGFA